MKKLILSTVLSAGMMIPLLGQDSQAAEEIYRRYSSGDGVFALSLNHEMLDAIDMDFDFDDQMKNISGDIYQVKFITFAEESESAARVLEISRDLKSAGLAKLPLPEDMEDEDLEFMEIYGEREASHFKNLYMLIISDKGETGIFLAINGKLKIREAS